MRSRTRAQTASCSRASSSRASSSGSQAFARRADPRGRLGLRRRFFALTYDRQLAKVEQAGLQALRQRPLADATGRVLEVGGGTGANLPFYGPGVASLTITEPEPAMLRRLERRVTEQGPQTKVLRAPAEDLPFDDDSVDVVVSTLVLCGVDDQTQALHELRRVLRPGGRLIFSSTSARTNLALPAGRTA